MDDKPESFENAKKLLDAHDDIRRINDTIRSNYAVQQHGSSLYRKLMSNQDYGEYIFALKAMRKMAGSIPFDRLDDDHKKEVLSMIKDAIEVFISTISASSDN